MNAELGYFTIDELIDEVANRGHSVVIIWEDEKKHLNLKANEVGPKEIGLVQWAQYHLLKTFNNVEEEDDQ